MHFHKVYKNTFLLTLLLAALVQPGAILAASGDAPYSLSDTLSFWGEAFVGGFPLILAYVSVQFLRTRDKRYLRSCGIAVVIVALVGAPLYSYFLRHWAAGRQSWSFLWFLAGCEISFLFSIVSIWYSPLAYFDPDNSYNLPLYIAELFLIASIALLWKIRKRSKE